MKGNNIIPKNIPDCKFKHKHKENFIQDLMK